ncbi:hypothetical protein ElyMa_004106800 [Elysia marginata]|uniref:Uncharacterized protein n=1 Tax=Elysia marginata TaxID=1093978 RepID=A0AAV4GDN1_9GAST|nr:hypothetical protein ElyMa_004106800 [Elysia marginata]
MDSVHGAPETAGTALCDISPCQNHESGSLGQSRINKYGSHDTENPASMDMICHPNAGHQIIKTTAIRQAEHRHTKPRQAAEI